jgi:uncharacterized membrane protein
MLEILAHWFAAVCGQDPGHTWAPGGILLPCCQRCTGLYVGAGVAALLHLWLRPRLTGRFLEIHGAFLLVMAPFGFHWVSQGPMLRTLTGMLFGFAVVTFLWLPLSQWLGERTACFPSPRPSPSGRGGIKVGLWEFPGAQGSLNRWQTCSLSLTARAGVTGKTMSNRVRLPTYLSFLVGTLIALPALAMLGGVLVAYVLSGLAFWGALALAALVVGDVSLGLLGAFRFLHRLTRPRLQP